MTVRRFSIVSNEFNLLPNMCIDLCEYNVFSRSFVCMKTFETFAILSVLCSPKCAYRLNTLNKSICTCIISVDESGRWPSSQFPSHVPSPPPPFSVSFCLDLVPVPLPLSRYVSLLFLLSDSIVLSLPGYHSSQSICTKCVYANKTIETIFLDIVGVCLLIHHRNNIHST